MQAESVVCRGVALVLLFYLVLPMSLRLVMSRCRAEMPSMMQAMSDGFHV